MPSNIQISVNWWGALDRPWQELILKNLNNCRNDSGKDSIENEDILIVDGNETNRTAGLLLKEISNLQLTLIVTTALSCTGV